MNGMQTVQTQIGKAIFLLPNFVEIPTELAQSPFAMWRAEPELDSAGKQKLKPNGKPKFNKAPKNDSGRNISKNKPEQWLAYDRAVSAFTPESFTGVGVLIQADTGLVGIDLDDVIDLLKANPSLKTIVCKAKNAGIYCERSPSDTGLRLFIYGRLPNNAGRRKSGIELYSDTAFLTITGHPVWKGEIKEAQWLIDDLLKLIGTRNPEITHKPPATEVTFGVALPEQVDALAEWAGYNYPQLWEGRWNEPRDLILDKDYPSQSEADMALVGCLAREIFKRGCSDESVATATVWEAFKLSGLHRPEKERQITNYAIPKAVSSAKKIVRITSHVPPEIAEVNSRFVLIEDLGIYEPRQGAFIKAEQFRLLYQNRIVNIGTDQTPKLITLDKIWLSSCYRSQYTGLEMSPGEGDRTKSGALNTYRGFVVEPIKADVQPFLELLAWLIPNLADQEFFLDFMAFKLQYPTARYAVAAVLWSITQGVGKNLLVEAWASLLDTRHWGVVAQEVFSDQFTEWQHLKLIAIADEVSSSNSRAVADRIKGWVTATQNRINEKGVAKFQEPNLTTYVFLSNHPDAVFLDDTDRRFWVTECAKQRPSNYLIENFVNWRDKGGKAYLLHYFLNRDTKAFNPREPAPMTHAKSEMIEDNKSDLERWLDRTLSAQNIAALFGRELASVEELTERYRHDTKREVSSKAVNGVLRKARVTRLDKQARRQDGTRPRVYALANAALYEQMTDSQLGQVMDTTPFKIY